MRLVMLIMMGIAGQWTLPEAMAQPAPPVAVSNDDGGTVVSADPESEPEPAMEPRVHRVYVPASELHAVLKKDVRGVLLSRDEFRRLWHAAMRARESQPRQPAEVVISAANLSARIEGEQLLLTGELEFTQFQRGWQILRIPVGGLSVERAAIDGETAAVYRDGEQPDTLLVFSQNEGEHRLSLDMSAELTPLGSDLLAEFALSGAPSGTLRLALPADQSLRVDGLAVSPSGGTEPDYRIPIGGRSRISLRITGGDASESVDSLLFAKTAYGLYAAPGEVTWTTRTELTVYGQTLDQLTFTVPATLDIAAVESNGLASWDMNDAAGGDRTEIMLTYRQPFSGRRAVLIRGMFVPNNDEWSVPTLLLTGADSHVASVLIRHDPGIRLQPQYDDAVRPADPEAADVGQGTDVSSDRPAGSRPLTPGPRMAFQTMRADFDLSFFTPQKQGTMQAAMTNLLHISDDGLDLQAVLDVQAAVAALFEIRLTLPAEFEVLSATASGQSTDWTPARGDVGLNEIVIPLAAPLRPGETTRVEVAAHSDPEDWPVAGNPVLIAFPEIGLPQADMIEARYALTATDDLQVATVDVTGLDPARGEDAAGLKRLAESLGRQLRLGFTYQDSTFTGELEISRRPARMAVSTLMLSRLEAERTVTLLRSTVTVDGGGVEGLLIQLPAGVSPETRFSVHQGAGIGNQGTEPQRSVSGSQSHFSPVIVEQTVSEPVDGHRTWAVRFDRRMHGTHVLTAVVTQPREGDATATLEVPTFVGAERQNGWIAVEARDDQRLTVTAADVVGQPLRPVDPIDLPMDQESTGRDQSFTVQGSEPREPPASAATGARRIVAGFRFTRPGATTSITEEQFDREAVPTAVANRLDLRSVLGPSGQLQHRLRVDFRAVGVQSLQLALPAESELWAVEIDGQPVEVQKSPAGYQMPLPQSETPDAARSMEVFYSTAAGDLQTVGRLQQTEPRLFIQQAGGALQPLDVLAHDWTLAYPRDIVLLESDGRFTAAEPLEDDTLIGRMTDAMRVPSAESIAWRLGIAAAAVIVAGLVYLVWHATRRTVMFMFGGAALVGVLLAGFLFYTFTTQDQSSVKSFATSGPPAWSADESSEASNRFLLGTGIPSGGQSSHDVGDAGIAIRQSEIMGGTPPSFSFQGDINAPVAPPAPSVAPGGAVREEAPADQPTDVDADGVVDSIAGRSPSAQQSAKSSGVRGALLSLLLDLDVPQGMRKMSFRSLGTSADVDAPALDVQYASRSHREVMALIVALGVILVFWWLRTAPAAVRGSIAIVAVFLPVALLTVIPSARSMIVEGALIGGVLGLLLWGVASLVERRRPSMSRKRPLRLREKQMVTTIVFVSLLVTNSSRAQNIEPARKSSPTTRAGQKEDNSTVPKEEIPTVIVPYEGDDPWSSDRVLLPRALFDRLRSLADPASVPTGPAPIEGLIAGADYMVEVDGGAEAAAGKTSLSVSARYVVYSFRDRPVSLKLPLRDVAVTAATLDSKPAVVRSNEDGGIEVIVAEAGRHQLEATFEVPAELRTNSGEFTLPLLPVAAGRLTVALPMRDDWSVSVTRGDGMPIGYRRQTGDDGRVRATVPIDRGGRISMAWQPEHSSGARQGIVNVQSITAVTIDDAGVSLRAAYDVEVRQAGVSRMVFGLPQTLQLKRLWGPDVGGWQLDDEGDSGERTLTVFFRRNVDNETRILVDLFLTESSAGSEVTVDVPQLAPRDVTRESGQIVILSDNDREIRITGTDGLVRTNALEGELPDGWNPQSLPARGTFRFNARPWQLSVSAMLRPQQTRVTAEHGMFVGRRKILLGTRLEFELQGLPRRLLRVVLPHDFLLVDLQSSDVSDWFVEAGELVLDLGQPRLGRISIAFEGHIRREVNEPEAVLETPLPLELDRQETQLAVWVDDGLTATLEGYAGWRPLAPDEISTELRSLHVPQPQFAFRSSAIEPELIIAQVERAQPQLAANAVTLIAVSDTSVDYGLTLRWTIERAAVDELTFITPDWLEGRLEFTGEEIRKTSSAFTDDGRVRWSVSLENAIRGEYLLSAVATLPPPANGLVTAPEVHFEHRADAAGAFTDIPLQRSFAVLVNLSSAQITAADGAAHEEVLPANLPFSLRDELLTQAMEVVRVPFGRPLTWQMQSVTEQRTATATVTSADLTTVLAEDGSWRTEAAYRVRNRGHQFLAIRIPAGARLLSAIVKERPARVSRTMLDDEPILLVPLPQTSAADLSFVVRIVLQGALPRPLSQAFSLSGERMVLPVPTVVTQRQSSEYGVPVVATNWTVSVPDDFDATPVTEGDATNVLYHTQGIGGVRSSSQQWKELADLNAMITDRSLSLSQRQRAAGSIRELASQLSHSADEADRALSGKGSDGVKLKFGKDVQRRSELLSESLKNAEELESSITQNLVDGDVYDATTNGRQYILGNSANIASDNQIRGLTQEQSPESGFRFDLFSRRSGNIPKGRTETEVPAQRSRAMLKEQLSAQERLDVSPQDFSPPSASNALPSQIAGSSDRSMPVDPFSGIGGGGGLPAVQSLEQNGALGVSDFGSGLSIGVAASFADAQAAGGQTGGLSLPIEIPVDGQTLEFSKQGGNPRLTLALRPRESVRGGLRWLWTAAWMALGILALRFILVGKMPLRWSPLLAIGSGAIGLLLLLLTPAPIAWLGVPLIVTGCAIGMWSRSHRATAAVSE